MPRGPARSTRPRVTPPTRWQRRAGCTASTHSLPVAVSKPGESATTPFGDTVRSAFSPRNGAVRRAREAVEKTIAPRPWKTLRGPHFTANKTADIIPRIYHSRSGFKLGQRYVLTCREIMKLPGETGIMAGAGGGPCWGLLGAVLAIPGKIDLAGLGFDAIAQREGRWAIVDLVGKHGGVRTVPMPSWAKAGLDRWAAAATSTPTPNTPSLSAGSIPSSHAASAMVKLSLRQSTSNRSFSLLPF